MTARLVVADPYLGDSIEPFLERLAYTVAWCLPRVSMEDPRGCLRQLPAPDWGDCSFKRDRHSVVELHCDDRKRRLGVELSPLRRRAPHAALG